MDHDEFINALNAVRLKGMENIPAGELLAAIYFDRKGTGWAGLVKNILVTILLDGNMFFGDKNPQICLIATYSYYGRPDLKHQFQNAVKCVKKKGVLIPVRKYSLRIHRFRQMNLMSDWNKELKKTAFSRRVRYRILFELFRASIFARETIEKIRKTGMPQLCVTFCDVHPADYLITHMLNQCGIKTATLQHGVYDHISKYEFTHSHSAYFLAINEYSKEEAVISGLDEKKIRILGPMAYIDKIPKIRTFVKKDKVYGILLNGRGNEASAYEDKKLLDFGCRLSEEKNLM